MNGYSLLLAFDTEAEEFRRGFEAGRLWALVAGGDLGPHMIHADNSEMAIRMADAKKLTVRGETLDHTWIEVTFE